MRLASTMSLDLVSRYSLIDTYHSDAIIAVSSAGRMFTAQRVFVMDIETTIAKSDYFEHVVLGAQGNAWVVLLGASLPSIPLNQLSTLNPVLLVFALPFMYVLGIMIDPVSHTILNPLRILIRKWRLGSSKCPNDYIGLHSPTLYAENTWRARRPRIPEESVQIAEEKISTRRESSIHVATRACYL